MRRYHDVRPRNVTWTDDEIAAVIDAAPPPVRLWLLLCSDLAIRSGTAARLAPEHYDAHTHTLRFVTKHNARVTMPTTHAIRELIHWCDPTDPRPYVRQLWRFMPNQTKPTRDGADPTDALRWHFNRLKKALGITRRLIPHDLRRTTAVKVLQATGDLRDVQAVLGHRNLTSTLWYLDHDARAVDRDLLESLKPNNKPKERTA